MTLRAESDTKLMGISPPINIEPPQEVDLKSSKQLEEVLKEFQLYETKEELAKRIHVLQQLNEKLTEFIQSSLRDQTLIDDELIEGRIFSFGSYRLGVHNRNADIDAVCILPRYANRTDFFQGFPALLKSVPGVEELHAVEDAYVPVIKLKYEGIDIDLLFARLDLKTIPKDLSLADDSLLRNLGEKCIRSLNGCRVAEEILKAIPDPESFKLSLRAIKLWAKNHGIYSNVLGYFGGVTWAILVARVCQLYPNAAASTIVQKFFFVYSNWDWPTPVFLKNISAADSRIELPLFRELVWDPRVRFADRLHLMPIITPAFPEQNSTPNVTASAKQIITSEIQHANEICLRISCQKAGWRKLFIESNFFGKYRHYIIILTTCKTHEDSLVYTSFVESKIRILVGILERNDCVKLAHINPRQYKLRKDASIDLDVDYENPVVNMWFLGLSFDNAMVKQINLQNELNNWGVILMNAQCMALSRGQDIYNEQMKTSAHYAPRNNLEKYLSPADNPSKLTRKLSPQVPIMSDTTTTSDTPLAEEIASILSTAEHATRKRKLDVEQSCGPMDKRPVDAPISQSIIQNL